MHPLALVVRRALLAGWALGLAACAASDFGFPDPSEDTPHPAGACQVDPDCPGSGLFICDTASARCQPACRAPEDCTAGRRGAYALAECDTNPLGCRCDEGQCRQAQCSTDGECAAVAPGQVCREGRCTAEPGVQRVRGCQVTPDFVVGVEGTPVRFTALARDATGAALVVSSGEVWTAEGPGVRHEGPDGAFVLTGPTDEALESVRVRLGSATCTARVRVLPAQAPAGQLHVAVVDELTGRPVPDAVVLLADTSGRAVHQGTTDAHGEVRLPAPTEPGSVSVFHEAHGYLTLAHAGQDDPSRPPLLLPLRRNPKELVGGARGALSPLALTELSGGLSGLSAPDEVTELSAPPLLASVRREAYSVDRQPRQAALPEGAWLVSSTGSPAVREVRPRGLAGVCDDALSAGPDERATLAGTCGVRAAWALGGELSPTVLSTGVGGVLDVGPVLASAVPQLHTFRSWVQRDVRFDLSKTGGDVALSPLLEPERSVPLGFAFAARVPALPRYRGAFLDHVAVLGVARVAGRGDVPLGLGLGVNTTPADQNTDTQPGTHTPGLVRVRMAPAHHGLERSPYALLVSAYPAPSEGSAEASSVRVYRALAPLPFDPKGSKPVEVDGPFLPIPEGARYDATRRWLRFRSEPSLPMAGTVLRAVFTNGAGRRWSVLFDAAGATTGLRLPTPPEPSGRLLEDRTYQGDLLGSRAELSLQVLLPRQTGARAGLGLDGLLTGVGLARLDEVTEAWSALNSIWPRVDWVEPALENQQVARGARVRVRVVAFQVGADPGAEGFVRLTFQGGEGCEGEVLDGRDVDEQGRGEVEFVLPERCQGSAVRLIARLVDLGGEGLSPPAERQVSVRIGP
jgi:hypothetical protein